MQNGFFKTYGKVILFAFLGISIVAAVIGQNKQNNTLAVYTSTDVVQQETLSDSSSEEDNIETQIYADNTYHFSISIPKDWTQVRRNQPSIEKLFARARVKLFTLITTSV